MSDYKFTNSWFDNGARSIWDQIVPQLKPKRILEIGSYEGASACYLIEKLASDSDIEIHCVDTWAGGIEHQAGGIAEVDMNSIESRFHHNTSLALATAINSVNLVVHKKFSDDCLANLISEGKKNYFDFIYVDGSHQAPDVLCDAVLSFKLLRLGGVIAFDDYLWSENLPYGKDPIRCPKPAIDAFVNLNMRKLQVLPAPQFQIYIKKISD